MPYGMTQQEFNRMKEDDWREVSEYLDRLAHWQWLKDNGQLDPDMRKPEPPAFAQNLEF